MKGLDIKKTLFLIFATGLTAACVHGTTTEQTAANASIGRYDIYTVLFDESLNLQSATFTPSGKVLVSYMGDSQRDRRQVNLAVMDDDGGNMRPFFSQKIPEREKDNGIRFMVFPDNKRIFLGDFVIECAPNIDDCDRSALLPVEYPRQVAGGDHVSHRWSEIIVAPDGHHVAWTTLLSNYSALVFTGELRKKESGYVIANPRIVSTLDPFEQDPKHPDGVIPKTLRGGEVKQFIHGGTAISLVGAVKRDIPDSVIQHLASGEMEAVTDTPGYTETTIFSPDERLGIVMTTRFSKSTNPAILGLLPRPYPASLNMGLSMFAYTYSVTGVRRSRPGNVGPALIEITASKSHGRYQGTNLNTQEEWVYRSPMSWHPSGKKAMWLEGRREDGSRRIQVVHLPDYQPAPPVPAKATPDAIPYASSDLSVVEEYAKSSNDIDVKVYGRHSGYIEYRRTPGGVIKKTYADFSDDGEQVYSGTESMESNLQRRSTYTAKVKLSGPKPGVMDLKMTFGPLGGDLPAQLIFAPDASGTPLTHGYVEYDGQRLDADSLVP